MKKLLPSQLCPSSHDTTLETEINSLIPMEYLTAAAEKKLVSMGVREKGLPSKHQLGIGMVYRHVEIGKPPGDAFVPRGGCTEAQKKFVDAWELLKEHLVEPFCTDANWDHEMVRKWAEADDKTPKRAADVKSCVFPPICIAETEWLTAEDGTPVKGTVRAFIQDPLSYDVHAEIRGPNTLIITGFHLPPSKEDLPPNTTIIDEVTSGPWKRTMTTKAYLDTNFAPEVVIVSGDMYAVACFTCPPNAVSRPSPPEKKHSGSLSEFSWWE